MLRLKRGRAVPRRLWRLNVELGLHDDTPPMPTFPFLRVVNISLVNDVFNTTNVDLISVQHRLFFLEYWLATGFLNDSVNPVLDPDRSILLYWRKLARLTFVAGAGPHSLVPL